MSANLYIQANYYPIISADCIPKFLLEEAKLDPNAKSNDGDTPLHVACTNSRNVELVQLLVRDERCNPHERNGNGNTALHVACRCNRSGKTKHLRCLFIAFTHNLHILNFFCK